MTYYSALHYAAKAEKSAKSAEDYSSIAENAANRARMTGLPIGFILPAVGKINDERFTLLDGKTLSKTGAYSDFCANVAEQVQAGNWFACTEEEYSADITAYNQCGKFVIGADYIRIPTITRFIGATVTLSEIGKTYKESLPNIEGQFSLRALTNGDASEITGAFTAGATGRKLDQVSLNTSAQTASPTRIFNASRSSSTYQDGAKVQPDHTKYPYYMVVSTEGQAASIKVDINKVYEDIELKANSNLSNLTVEGKSLASGLGMPSDKIINLTLGATGTSYTAPANGWVRFTKKAGANGQLVQLSSGKVDIICNAYASGQTATCFLPVKKGETFYAWYNATGETLFFHFCYAEGEI